jgi:Leucine-rich repeat (LRR) protein
VLLHLLIDKKEQNEIICCQREHVKYENCAKIRLRKAPFAGRKAPIAGIKANSFSRLKNLTELDLRECESEQIEAGAFNDLHRLKKLNLSDNPIKEIKVKGIITNA